MDVKVPSEELDLFRLRPRMETRRPFNYLVERHGFDVEVAEGVHNVYVTLGWIAWEWLTASDALRYKIARRFLLPWLARRARRSEMHVHTLSSAYRVIATRLRGEVKNDHE